ncbi:MAG: hypothetical protein WCG95_03985 [bacterium]
MAEHYKRFPDLFRSAKTHIYRVKTPQDVLIALETNMPELGITYNSHKSSLPEWYAWLEKVKNGEWSLSPLVKKV